MPECTLPSVRSTDSHPERQLLPSRKDKMTENTTKKKTKSRGRGAAIGGEKYLAPAAPSKGKIIAIDCHPDIFTAAVLEGTSPANAVHLTTKADLALDQLLAWLSKEFTSEDIILMEAGANSFELHTKLSALGLRACVLESAWVGKQATNYADNDKIAAVRIGLVYLQGNAPAVWVPDALTRQRRELLHLHQTAKRDLTQSTNALKGYLNQYTVRVKAGKLHTNQARNRILRQREWEPAQLLILEDHLENVVYNTKRSKKIEREICAQVASTPKMLALMSLLGIAQINAFALIATIGEVTRFADPRKLACYIGLNPGQRQSGKGKDIRLGMGKRGRKDMRCLLIQAAQAVLRHSSKTNIGRWGMKLFMRKGNRNIAVAAVARKLSAQVWHLLMGHRPEMLEPTKSRHTKYIKLLGVIGKLKRTELKLPTTLEGAVEHLDQLVKTFTPPSLLPK